MRHVGLPHELFDKSRLADSAPTPQREASSWPRITSRGSHLGQYVIQVGELAPSSHESSHQ
ncbi:hypothetical protein GCM10009838_05760 [Catenulispora subtropica]|uniref:Uncharacterized protein n=1 Tax=Catenulispora subtropica TaxID=450798 RepID=A0ABP5BY59_9ACTN